MVWPDGYRLVIKQPDQSRAGVFRAETTAYHDEQELTVGTINFLSLRDREQFTVSAAGSNGLAPILWDDRLQQAYSEIINAQADAPTDHALVTTMDTVEAHPVEWAWWPYIAIGTICMLDGDPGIGKSLLMAQLAASLSKDDPLPDQQGKPTLPAGGSHHTLILSTEDSLAHTLKPRLEAAGADCSKIHVLTGWVDGGGHERAFTLEHLPLLETEIQRYQPRLVVIDPVTAYMGKVDIHRANEVQELLGKLGRLAERYQCAIVCIRHPAKPGQSIGKVIHRGLGSVGFIGTARTALFVEQHPTNPHKVLLGQSKSNLAGMGRTQLFSKDHGQFEWCGVSRLSAEVIGGSGRGPDPTAFLEAVFWLEDQLKDGIPQASETLREDAEEYGIAFRTLRRAKQALQIRSIKRGKDPAGKESWDWQLPSLTMIHPPDSLYGPLGQQGLLGQQGPLGPLQQKQQDREIIVEEVSQEQVGGGGDQEAQESQEGQGGQVGHVIVEGFSASPETPVLPACPQCHCTSLLVLGAYRKCPLCNWKGLAGEAKHVDG